MIQIDLATLVKRLNPFAKQALEMAASECMSHFQRLFCKGVKPLYQRG